MNAEIIGNRIKALLILHNMKRSYLAKEMGISYNTLTRKLNGQREIYINEMYKIKKIFNLGTNFCANLFFNDKFTIEK